MNSVRLNGTLNPFISEPYVSPRDSLPIGSLLANRYGVERLIGRGAYSAVFQAYDTLRNETVALKVAEVPACDPEVARAVLEHESRMYARICGHPNVLVVHDLHVVPCNGAGPLLLLSMEWADGGSLRDWLDQHRSAPHTRVVEGQRHFMQMLSGTHAIHKAGLVHRDLKPENILFVGGLVKVSDLGAARSLRDIWLASSSEIWVPPHGTPVYMSPEMLANPVIIDKRSDIYALGAIGYEIFSVESRPFAGGMDLQRNGRDSLPTDLFLPEVPEHLIQVISRCLETN